MTADATLPRASGQTFTGRPATASAGPRRARPSSYDHAATEVDLSQEFLLRILTRVSPRLIDEDDLALATMLRAALEPLSDVRPITRQGTLPRFGLKLRYDASRFADVSGVAAARGTLAIGIECRGAWDPYREVDEGARRPVETRLDRVLLRVSAMSEGPPGEVAGCVVDDDDPEFASDGGRPILRCRDGVLRRVWVAGEGRDRGAGPDPRVTLPTIVPSEAIHYEEGPNLEARLDVEALRRRFGVLDLAPTRALVSGR